MKKYRKKPVVIEAEQWIPCNLVEPKPPVPDELLELDADIPCWYIKTLEGPHRISPGDYIIKGIRGEYYPCKPDIFEATYEEV